MTRATPETDPRRMLGPARQSCYVGNFGSHVAFHCQPRIGSLWTDLEGSLRAEAARWHGDDLHKPTITRISRVDKGCNYSIPGEYDITVVEDWWLGCSTDHRVVVQNHCFSG